MIRPTRPLRPVRLALRLLPQAALLGLLASGPGCGALDARLEARTVCFTESGYLVPGDPGGIGPLTTELAYDLGNQLPILSQPDTSYTLALQSLQLSVAAGSPSVDLGGIDTLEVSAVAPPGSSLPEPVLVRYQKTSDPHPTAIAAASPSGVDLAPYVSGGRITVRAAAAGSLPRSAWRADVKGCFLLTVDVNYGKKL